AEMQLRPRRPTGEVEPDVAKPGRGRRDREIQGALLHILGASEHRIPVELRATLDHKAAGRTPGADLHVGRVDHRCRPGASWSKRPRYHRGGAQAVLGLRGGEL